MNPRRRIAVVTGTRAEFGLLRPLIQALEKNPAFDMLLLVTGTHLAADYGRTIQEIYDGGHAVAAQIDMQLGDDSALGISKSMSLALAGFAEAYAQLQPDIVVLLGDRYEILAAASAALVARIPIAHLHGGELTEGAFDDAIRHAITKMAHLHFVAAEPYRNRVLQLGEAPDRVYTVGMTGLDHLATTKWMTRAELSTSLGCTLGERVMVVTYHPVTLDNVAPELRFAELLAALESYREFSIVFTHSNADPGSGGITRRIADFCTRHANAVSVASLGSQRYLSLVRLAHAVVGNSSSGLTEAPALGTATVNIGPRQQGRLRSPSVLDCDESKLAIEATLQRALSPEFQALADTAQSVYGGPGASARIETVLQTVDFTLLLHKHFVDHA